MIDDELRPGRYITITANQGEREATILAVLGNEFLCEYYMPKGSSSLRIVTIDGSKKDRPIAYANVPTKWLQEIVDGGKEWQGTPQQNGARVVHQYHKKVYIYRHVASAAEMLKERLEAKAK